MAVSRSSYNAICRGMGLPHFHSLVLVSVCGIRRLFVPHFFSSRRCSFCCHASDSPSSSHFVIARLRSTACDGAVLLYVLVCRLSFPRWIMRNQVSNKAGAPNPAITL